MSLAKRDEARRDLFAYIEGYYNRRRSTLPSATKRQNKPRGWRRNPRVHQIGGPSIDAHDEFAFWVIRQVQLHLAALSRRRRLEPGAFTSPLVEALS